MPANSIVSRRPAPAQRNTGVASHALDLAMRRPGQTVLSALGAAICVAVVINALAFQTKRHPAPLFAPKDAFQTRPAPPLGERPAPRSVPLTQASPAAARTALATGEAAHTAPLPPARPTGIGALIEQAARPSAPVAQAAPRSEPRSTEARPVPPQPVPARRDQIAQLLQGVEIAPQSTARIAAAQRALSRLGYGNLTADGALGPETSAALRQFEQDRNLPLTGELAPRTARALSAEAGIPIE